MRSPQRSDYVFSQTDYAMYVGSYIAIVEQLIKEEHLTFADVRILAAIKALTNFYDWRLNPEGVSELQVKKLTSFREDTVKKRLTALAERGLVQRTVIVEGKRKIYRHLLTKQGKTIANSITEADRVHEKIIAHMYKVKLLK